MIKVTYEIRNINLDDKVVSSIIKEFDNDVERAEYEYGQSWHPWLHLYPVKVEVFTGTPVL